MEKFIDLRQQAEKAIDEQTVDFHDMAVEDIEALVHELRVHQIELEMQNEALREAQQQVQESRHKYTDLYDSAPTGYFVLDKNGLIQDVNLTGAQQLGIVRADLIKKPLIHWVNPPSRAIFHEHRHKALATQRHQTCEIQVMGRDKHSFHARLESIILPNREGEAQLRITVININKQVQAEMALKEAYAELEQRVVERTHELLVANEQLRQEVQERTQAQAQLGELLNEKEVLLKEIHHRVKNNLQVVSSLLYLQSAAVEDERVRTLLESSRTRIKSIALIHEALYQSKTLNTVSMNEYIHNLTKHLFYAYGVNSEVVTLVINVDDVFLEDLNMILSLGIIVNELVSNALKYAFPEGKRGEVLVKLHVEAEHCLGLIVSDNGIGCPSDLNFLQTKSLGLQLIRMLTTQLHGRLEFEQNEGTTVRINFLNIDFLSGKEDKEPIKEEEI